jgi:hypothetical protein
LDERFDGVMFGIFNTWVQNLARTFGLHGLLSFLNNNPFPHNLQDIKNVQIYNTWKVFDLVMTRR